MSLDRYKEHDLEFREKLKREISKSTENFKNIIDDLYEKKDTKKINTVKKVMDELNMFSNDISLSKSGHKYPMFSSQTSTTEEMLQRVINFDKFISEKLSNVTETSSKIADLLIDEKHLDFDREFKKIRQYITNARNHYKKRDDLIKGVK